MKPAWDRLMGDFKGHATALVADDLDSARARISTVAWREEGAF